MKLLVIKKIEPRRTHLLAIVAVFVAVLEVHPHCHHHHHRLAIHRLAIRRKTMMVMKTMYRHNRRRDGEASCHCCDFCCCVRNSVKFPGLPG